MSMESLPEANGYLVGVNIPDNISGAVRIERSERKKDFRELRKQLERVSEFSVGCNKFEQSFHTLPIAGGTLRLLFRSIVIESFGQGYRVMVNRETTLPNDGRRMNIDDFVVSRNANIIATDHCWMKRGHHSFTWTGILEDHGPIVGLNGAIPAVYTGKDYVEPQLTTDFDKFEEILW